MKPEEIHLYDLPRILMGEVPPAFLIEAFIRILFLFLLLIIAIRLMGRRMASSLTRNELAALTSLAAAIGVPVLGPDRGLLPALIIALIVIAIQRAMAYGVFKSKKLERAFMDHNNILIADGCLNLPEVRKAGLSQERIFAQLRSSGVDSLGKVQRLYFEPAGRFTLIEAQHPVPGLSTIPNWDQDYFDDRKKLPGQYACANCGNVINKPHQPDQDCNRCGKNHWLNSVE